MRIKIVQSFNPIVYSNEKKKILLAEDEDSAGHEKICSKIKSLHYNKM